MRAPSARMTALLCLLAALSACTDRAPGPTGLSISASRSGVPFASGLASPAWQATAATGAVQAGFAPFTASRALSLLGVAQYLAVQRAEGADGGGGRDQLELDRGAVAGASAVVLTYLFPSQAQAFQDLVAAQATAGPGGQAPHPAFTRGESVGRAVGAEIVTRAKGDGFNTPFTGTIPVGSGLWISNTTPATIAGGQLPTSLPWFLTSAGQFRPAPPPAFGSAAFTAGLTEIRQMADNRTADQIQIAAFWAPKASGFWIQVGTDGINQHGLSEREATHLYALLSATVYDAFIGCWDTKQTFWLIRPWQADLAITTLPSVGKPNHPSYPSGHSCVSSSAAEVLGTFFPEQRADLQAMVTEAGLSRMYGGIHYRFDIVAGQALGRNVAQFTIAADASGNSVLTPR